ncbi:MAG: hypothetical protein Q9210_002367, partial [Variospora velana]
MPALPDDEAGLRYKEHKSSALKERLYRRFFKIFGDHAEERMDKTDERIKSEVKEPLLEEQTIAQLLCPPDSTKEQE